MTNPLLRRRALTVFGSVVLTLAGSGCTPQAVLDDPLAGDGQVAGTQSTQNTDGPSSVASLVRAQPEELRFGSRASLLRLYLRNVSQSPLTLSVTTDARWITLASAATELAPGKETRFDLTLDRSALSPGENAAAIAVAVSESSAAPLLVPVTAMGADPAGGDATPTPNLQVTPAALNFGERSRTMSLLVRNRGAGVLEYAATSDQPWLTLSNPVGSSEGQYRTVGVRADRTGLAPGDYAGSVTVAGGGTSVVVPVTMNVAAAETGGTASRLTVSHSLLNFGVAQNQRTILVRYVGGEPTTYTVESSVPWAMTDVASGTNSGEYDPVRVTVQRSGLAGGEYSGELRVALGDGREQRVNLTMTVNAGPPAEPELWLSSDLLLFSGRESEELFQIRNSGGGTLQYAIFPADPEVDWLSVIPATGECTDEADVITARVDRSRLSDGTFNTQLTVQTGAGQTETLSVLVENTSLPEDADPPDLVDWPSSDQNLSYVVLVQQYAVPNLGPWSCCALSMWGTSPYLGYVSMLIEPQHTESDLAALFEAVKAYIRANIPGAVYCSYISAGDCRRLEHMEHWPYTMVPYEEMPPGIFRIPYREDTRRAPVDLTNMDNVILFADKIIEHTIGRDVPVIWMDNVRHPMSGGTNAQWTSIAALLGRVTHALHEAGMRTVANIAMVPYGLTEADNELLMASVDGVALEMPFHPNARAVTQLMERDIQRLRQWMDHGMHVELIPRWFPEGGNRDDAHTFMAGMIMILRRPGDSIFTSHVFFLDLPHWAWWPRDFGPPLGDYTIIAHDPPVYRREFQHAVLTVDVGKTLNAATHGQAVQVEWR